MNTKLFSPKTHAIIDYALVGSLIALPSLFKLNKTARKIYLAEALVLLPYVAITDQPLSVKALVPFKTHGKIDVFNVANFAFHSFFKPFKKDKKALVFNTVFTAIAAVTVALTDWEASPTPTKGGR